MEYPLLCLELDYSGGKNSEDDYRYLLIQEFAFFDDKQGPEKLTVIDSKYSTLKYKFTGAVLDDQLNTCTDGAFGFRITNDFDKYLFKLRPYDEATDAEYDQSEWLQGFVPAGKGPITEKALKNMERATLYADFREKKIRWKVISKTQTIIHILQHYNNIPDIHAER